jgi:HD-GYP domain-containing protein (c-di-GMP phosphodiesterase class II)
VYEVNAETADNIKAGIIRTLTLTVVVILATSITLYPIIIFLNQGLVRLSSALLKSNVELMEVLGSAIAMRDADTHLHNYRVTVYAIRLAEALGLSKHNIQRLIAGAFLHDVGKIGISDTILLKPARLTAQEFQVMRTHLLLGVDIIAKADWLQGARDVVEFHHEKFDGSGYMKGLKGEAIPLNARIFAIVDVFDALTSRRPYKEPFSFDDARAIMRRGRGSHFDPRLLDEFDAIAPKLFAKINNAEDAVVEATLRKLLNKYYLSIEDLAQT